MTEIKAMRDVVLEEIYNHMLKNEQIFLLSADFGSPVLDKIRNDFKERFINVGIAEQNLINIAAGLALEGKIVFCYAIVPFLTMRAYEQIRVNLALLSQLRKINVNLIGVGAGLSYDVSGPTHQSLEDISIMRTLPNLTVFSPSDWVVAKSFVDYSIKNSGPKYFRLDAKPLPNIYEEKNSIKIKDGMTLLKKGKKVCLVSTGIMTHKALNIANTLSGERIEPGIIDVFMLKPLNEELLINIMKNYKFIFTLEEGFIGKGGLDSIINKIAVNNRMNIRIINLGFPDKYTFDIGDRNYLHKLSGLAEDDILNLIKKEFKKEK